MKLLIISNNPLSLTNSNGRTLLNMLGNIDKNDILNFYINGSNPAFEKASYIKIDEKKLLRVFYRGAFITQIRSIDCNALANNNYKKKTAFKSIVRSCLWHNKKIERELIWHARVFGVDRIVVQCGDADFLLRLSVKVSLKINAKLFSFNSEDYPFKAWDYFNKTLRVNIAYRYFKKRLLRSYDLLYRHVVASIYLTSRLLFLYKARYPDKKHYVIYNSSFLNKCDSYNSDGDIVYSGNIGVGRIKSLEVVAKHVYMVFNKQLIVFSNTNNKDLIDAIKRVEYVTYKGNLSYENNVNELRNAKLLVHVESFDPFYLLDTQNSFSTKIADSLSLGIPFLVYAPKMNYISQYIYDNDCAFVCNDENELHNTLQRMSSDRLYMLSKKNKAVICSNNNHNYKKNSKSFYDILGMCQ